MMIGNAREARASAPVFDRDHPPELFVEAWRSASALRPELTEDEFRNVLWPYFSKLRHKSEADALDHFVRILAIHQVRPRTSFKPTVKALPRAVERSASESRLHAVGQSLALLALEEGATGPPEIAPSGA